jgi:hypothetical protein
MTKKKLLTVVAAATANLCMMASGAQAATVFDNGGPADNGNEVSQWVQAEDFTLASAANLTGAKVNLFTFGASLTDVPLNYYIFAHDGNNPGGLLASGTGNSVTITENGVGYGGRTIYAVSFNFVDAFSAAANTTYWFGIHATDQFNRAEIYFASSAANGTNSAESYLGSFNNWNNNGAEHSFSLQGDFGSAVPEPTTWAMMIVGFGTVGTMVRTSRRRNAFSAD